jgi:hypothetical protein
VVRPSGLKGGKVCLKSVAEQYREHTRAGDTHVGCSQIAEGPTAGFQLDIRVFVASRGCQHDQVAWHGCGGKSEIVLSNELPDWSSRQEAPANEMDPFGSVGCRLELAERTAEGPGIGQQRDQCQEPTVMVAR